MNTNACGFWTAIFLLWFGAIALAAIDTHYVSLDGTNNSPYTNWPDAATNIQDAISASTALDTVLVSNGTYNLVSNIYLAVNITLQGFKGKEVTRVNGNNYGGKPVTNRCLYITTGTVDGFTFYGGVQTSMPAATMNGGGIYVAGGCKIQNCTIMSNIVYGYGGGIHVAGGDGTIISNCLIIANIQTNTDTGGSEGGGGGFNNRMVKAKLVDCIISSNWSGNFGGGVVLNQCSGGPNMERCLVSDNYAGSSGGGVRMYASGPFIADCIISNNYAGSGGGVHFYTISTANLLMSNCTIVANRASSGGGLLMGVGGTVTVSRIIGNMVSGNGFYGGGVNMSAGNIYNSLIISNVCIDSNTTGKGGGGIYMTGGTVRNCLIAGNELTNRYGGGVRIIGADVKLENCTIVRNRAGQYSGGIYHSSGTVTNCIVYYNISPTSNDVYSTNASFFGYNCIGNLSGFNQNISDAPKFIDAGTGFGTNSTMGNYRLGGDAPCINAGTNQGWMTTTCPYDLDGRPRVRYDTVDMGAYEFIHSGTVFGFR